MPADRNGSTGLSASGTGARERKGRDFAGKPEKEKAMADNDATASETCRTLLSPTGKDILGTKELLVGRAEIVGFDPNDEPIYEGTTKIFWDDAATACKDGKPIYLDEDGAEWTLDQLVAPVYTKG
jgi:hypothetical protein